MKTSVFLSIIAIFISPLIVNSSGGPVNGNGNGVKNLLGAPAQLTGIISEPQAIIGSGIGNDEDRLETGGGGGVKILLNAVSEPIENFNDKIDNSFGGSVGKQGGNVMSGVGNLVKKNVNGVKPLAPMISDLGVISEPQESNQGGNVFNVGDTLESLGGGRGVSINE